LVVVGVVAEVMMRSGSGGPVVVGSCLLLY